MLVVLFILEMVWFMIVDMGILRQTILSCLHGYDIMHDMLQRGRGDLGSYAISPTAQETWNVKTDRMFSHVFDDN